MKLLVPILLNCIFVVIFFKTTIINPKFKNNGYATEALEASIKTLLDMGFNEVKTGAFIENLASFRVMEKAGMAKSDYTDQISYNGKMHTCIYYHMRKN